MSDKLTVLVVKDETGRLYHLRVDRPFERPLAKLMSALSLSNKGQSPRMIASVWIEELNEEEYHNIDKAFLDPKLPSFVTTEEP
jgi:hypothetical protein